MMAALIMVLLAQVVVEVGLQQQVHLYLIQVPLLVAQVVQV
jgi:hypothetical protein